MSESYIVRLVPTASDTDVNEAIDHFKSSGGNITHRHTLFKGFSGNLPSDKASVLETLPHVEAVELDQKVHIM